MRYAHPFFVASAKAPGPAAGEEENWHKQNLGPLPPIIGDGHMDLIDIIGKDGVNEINHLGEIRFHALGDSGCGGGDEAERVADDMATDFNPSAGALNPAFLLHLGDVVYGTDKTHNYTDRFYRPYRHYPGKILAIPGNHDGEVKSPDDAPSLSAFRENFCTAHAAVPAAASGIGVYRQTMTQPGVYWMLDAPFMRVIGLYSNLLENPGFLQGKTAGGAADTSQIDWFAKTIKALKGEPKKALVIATHHPPYSQGGHSGSTAMGADIDAACKAAGLYPDLFLSGHAHNYQRYTRRIDGKMIVYVVSGTGGMSPQPVGQATGQPATDSSTVTYDRSLASLGYSFLTVSAKQLKVEFWPLGSPHGTAFDSVTVDLT
ncbi:metallophosphoesterase [Acidisoma cellulosilytica]|uniref:Metallophosphoesterase n=1 Tax=Acidisoma cellulosilyticum TaxID=2802395 RepID=A0A963YZD6_9PROT|nr:metallophosphoesterase [Acidisoma cellulosilyticum]MCB8879731.1 metallophosphoesterase [Acidisoma cellulosilyticum]